MQPTNKYHDLRLYLTFKHLYMKISTLSQIHVNCKTNQTSNVSACNRNEHSPLFNCFNYKALTITIFMSNLVMLEQSCSKLTYDLWLSRLCMTLTFNPRSFKPFKIKDFVTFHVCCKFGKIWTIQLKVKIFSFLDKNTIS